MRRLLMTIILSAAAVCTAVAQVAEKVYTSDGSVYHGFISEQIPGKSIKMYVSKAFLSVQESEMSDLAYSWRLAGSLPGDALDYLSKSENKSDKIVKTASFSYRGFYYEDCLICPAENGILKFALFGSRTVSIPWKYISATEKTDFVRDIQEVVTLHSGEILKGRIIKQNIARNTIFESSDGERYVIDNNEIMSVGVDCGGELFTRSMFLDNLTFNDGRILKGVITLRSLGKSVTVVTKDDRDGKEYDIKSIVKYGKELNEDYYNSRKDDGRKTSSRPASVKTAVSTAKPAAAPEKAQLSNQDASVCVKVNGTSVELVKSAPVAGRVYVNGKNSVKSTSGSFMVLADEVEMCESVKIFRLTEVSSDKEESSCYYNEYDEPCITVSGDAEVFRQISFTLPGNGVYYVVLTSDGCGFMAECLK